MRQQEAVAAIAVFVVLGVSCILLNTIVQGQHWPGERLTDRTLQASPITNSAGHSTLTQKGHARQTEVAARKKVLGIVGVQTGFSRPGASRQYNYELRRQALRSTWFPSSQSAIDSFEEKTGLVVRFVIGHSTNVDQEQAIEAEAEQYGGFMRLPMQEAYMSLTQKTLAFFGAITKMYDADYIVKVDDDVFLRIDRLPYAFKQWDEVHADYIGCMKTGEIMKDPHWRWYEPQHEVLGSTTYFTHAWGSLYVVSGRIAAILSAVNPGTLRFFNNEDVTVGGWMLAFNTTHMDDRRLCMDHCDPSSIGVYDMPQCAGLCDAVKSLPELYGSPACSDSAVHFDATELPRIRPIFRFQRQHW